MTPPLEPTSPDAPRCMHFACPSTTITHALVTPRARWPLCAEHALCKHYATGHVEPL